jgi:predicted metal-dependent peptidase
MNAVSTRRKPEDVIRLAKYLLFKYAPITHTVLGFAEFVFDDVNTVASCVEDGRLYIKINHEFVDTIEPQELAVIFYIEAVRIGLGHVTTRLYSDKKISLIASDLIALRMGLCSDIGVNNTAYGKVLAKVSALETNVNYLYYKKYYKPYDYRNASIEILYRLLTEGKNGGQNNDGEKQDDSSENNPSSGMSTYLNDETRADQWSAESSINEAVEHAAVNGGSSWGTAEANGVISMLSKSGKVVDGRTIIKKFVVQSIECGWRECRFKRNRRFDLMYPGHINEYKAKLLVAGDVSRSMPTSAVSRIISLILAVGKDVDIDYCWWNTQCTKPVHLTPLMRKKKQFTVSTGGGTDCNCVFRMLDTCRTRYNGIIIVSDMDFYPELKLAKRYRAGKILWVKTKPYMDPPKKYAKKVVDLNELEH